MGGYLNVMVGIFSALCAEYLQSWQVEIIAFSNIDEDIVVLNVA